ncbi:MAG: riboflavin synthase [Candidatus Gorgyraea atricola]|nr:riboflavin synthase [Candidatus Gorgyraea atricola]
MFTGIIEEMGSVAGIARNRLRIRGALVSSDAKIGDSIAINGTCLSVTDIKGEVLSFDAIQETLKRTTLGQLKINDPVNLERSLKADSRMGGHFVTGHIDYTARIIDILKGSGGTGFRISLSAEFSGFVVEKGSIALDGISLTVANVTRETFTVYLIPHTLKVTTFGKKKKGDFLNVETDLLAKYLAKQTQKPSLENVLKKYNYIG